MILYLWTRDDGITDNDFKDGDIFMIKPDSWEPNIGDQEMKSWLIIKMQDHPQTEELVSSEYAPGPGEEPVVRRVRKYRIDWRQKFTPEEIDIILDANQTLGVIADKFGHGDISRK